MSVSHQNVVWAPPFDYFQHPDAIKTFVAWAEENGLDAFRLFPDDFIVAEEDGQFVAIYREALTDDDGNSIMRPEGLGGVARSNVQRKVVSSIPEVSA